MTANDVVMATDAADAAAVDDVRSRYAEVLGYQASLGAQLFGAVGTSGTAFDDAHQTVQEFVDLAVLPQLRAAESVLYPAASGVERARLLVEGLIGETRLVEQAVTRIARDIDRVQIAAHVEALRVLLEAVFGKVAELLLPVLAEARTVSLAAIAAQLPALPTDRSRPAESGHGHTGCSCGETDHEVPELDVREIPHAIRHATVFGAFDAVPVGGSMILVAHHDPIPLLHQLAERSGGRLEVGYEQRGPDAWRLRLSRR